MAPDEMGAHDVEAACNEPNGVASGERSSQQQVGFSYPTVTLSVIAGDDDDRDDTPAAEAEEAQPTFPG